MSIDVGTGLAVLGVCGTVTTALIKFVPSRTNSASKNGNGYVRKETCEAMHKGMDAQLKVLVEDVREIRRLVEMKHG